MTRHQAQDFGPLFGWESGKSGLSRDRRDFAESLGDSGPKTKSPESPDSEKFRTGNSPMISGKVRSPEIHPLRGDTSPDFSAVPSDSSAALTLRSQRTESGGLGPKTGSLEAPEADQSYKLNPPIAIGTQGPNLRPYQLEAIEAIEREQEAGRRTTLLVLPTGCGKTVVFAERARRCTAVGGRVLVLAHRTELLEQAAKKLFDVGVKAAIEQGERRADPRVVPVVVASVQTLRGARLERYAEDAFTDIVVDEAHHTAATSYRNVLERFPQAFVLGVTATPDRGDGKALGKIFESVAYSYEMRRAIAEQYLVPLRAKRILVEELDLSDVKTHHGDFDQNQLSALLNEEENLLGVVKPLLEQAGDRKTLVFGVDVAHARALADVINTLKPGKAIALDGTAKPDERRAVLSLYRKGAFQFLCNCALFTEGFDEPDVACVALARPTQSRALYTQMLGRGTRLVGSTYAESIANGKPDCLILDFVGNSGKHRLVGPADALAGRELSEDERKLAEKSLDGQLELEEVLADAEREAQEAKSRRRREMNGAALVMYREREVDLFLGDHMPAFDPDSPAAKRPATAQQLADIEAAKLGKPPVGLSEAEAVAMLTAVKERRSAGLCTIPQARLLEKNSCDTKGMTFDRARALITILSGGNWKPWSLAGQPEYKPNRRRA